MSANNNPAISAALAEMIPHFHAARLAEMRADWARAVAGQRAADSALESVIGDALVIEDGMIATGTATRVTSTLRVSGWRAYAHLSGAFGSFPLSVDRTAEAPADYRRNATVYAWAEDAASKSARRWAEDVCLTWQAKMNAKLGRVQNVTCEFYGADGRVSITGEIDGHAIRVNQRPVWKWRDSCGSFVQWPALLYVDGERVTEAEYKARFC